MSADREAAIREDDPGYSGFGTRREMQKEILSLRAELAAARGLVMRLDDDLTDARERADHLEEVMLETEEKAREREQTLREELEAT